MKSVLSIGALLTLAASSSVFAGSLTIPMAFEYLALDGQAVATNKFTHKADLELTPGTHKIAIRYHDSVQDEFSDAQTFIKSAPFILTLVVDGDHQYFLKPAGGEVVKSPKKFANAPQVVISRADKGAVNYQVAQTNYQEDSLTQKLFGNSSGVNVAEASVAATAAGQIPAAKATSVAALTQKDAPKSNATVAQSSTISPTSAASAGALPAASAAEAQSSEDHAQQMLQYWWLQADEKTRKEFMSWAIKQL